MRRILFVAAVVCLAVSTAKAQDPVKIDPNSWKVEFENAQVRVLRVHIPPHGKLGMHEHPANVLIPLKDGHVKDIFPDGKTAEVHVKAGQATWRAAVKHANENLGDTPVESILVELKAKPADFTSGAAKRATSLNGALSQLSAKAPPEQLRNVQSKAAKWQQTKAEKDWIEVTDAVYMAAKGSDAKSDVTIATSRGNGATVKYQTLGQRKRNEKPTTAKGLTVTVEPMYIGMYHIWSERGGSPTSNKDDQFDIAEPKEKVTLQENK